MTIHQYIEEHGMPVQGIKGKLLYAEDWEGLMNEFMESAFNAAMEENLIGHQKQNGVTIIRSHYPILDEEDWVQWSVSDMSTERLRQMKKEIEGELSRRSLTNENSKAYNQLINVLRRTFDTTESHSVDELFALLTEYTEQEFSRFKAIGKITIALAKKELTKRNLSFKKS